MDLMQFLRMGGYAVFVWPAFAVTAIVLIANIVWARRRVAAVHAAIRRRHAAQGGAA